jgi:hypothetical protein
MKEPGVSIWLPKIASESDYGVFVVNVTIVTIAYAHPLVQRP